ncbi:MAG TPA: heparan-alpha-glucosaminide N-acetyltransferase domain-containing protein [Verrucomicrobiae bacterium]|nr:heparan-alpha-glucosaminide N-acetyltransferase domain-containing protein [Verrucomicrobiae bacterium]
MNAVAPVETPSVATAPVGARLESIDLLRGLVMVLMALDHTRDFFHNGVYHFQPLDLSQTTPAIFLTRWITHFCAPVFVFLAGTGAYLSRTRGKSTRELSWFLLTRGAWLVLLEVTWIKCFGWTFGFDFSSVSLIVIWALGCSMIVLAGLVHLPTWAAAAFGLVLMLGHNALDGVKPEDLGGFGELWRVLHAGGDFELVRGFHVIAGYPLVPWIGVMAAGYAMGQLITQVAHRRRVLAILGASAVLLFVALRLTRVYGEPQQWSKQASPLWTLLSMLDCRKYPPSLCYLLMTLGPALLFLALFDGGPPRALRPLLVFGRVPMFFYLLHLPLIHGLSVLANFIRFGHANWLYGNTQGVKPPPDAGFDLPSVYVAWAAVILMLYPVCRWFAALKARSRAKWLGYF